MKPMHGLRNRLVRRLGMHANMSGLFHFNESVQGGSARAGEPGLASAVNATGLPLAKAFLPAPEPDWGPDPVPSILAPTVQAPTVQASSAAPYASPKLPLERPRPVPARVEPPQPVPSANVFRAPGPDRIALPAAEEHSQPAEGDPVWHRLQNIFNKHRNKDALQEAASLPQPQEQPASPPDATAPPIEETDQASASLKPESPMGNEPGMPLVHHIQAKRETASLSPVEHSDAPSPGIKGESNIARTEQGPASAEISSEAVSSPADIIQASSESSPGIPLPTSTRADQANVTKPLPGPDSIQEAPGLDQGEVPSLSLSRAGAEPPDLHVTSLQSLPLEAVWAVETTRLPQSQSTFPPVPKESDKPVFHGEDIDRPGESANADQPSIQRSAIQDEMVRSALQNVQTAHATDSGVEFIPPRRPRSVPVPAGTSETVIESSRMPAEAPQATLQRQADADPQNETVASGVVSTEIGPLPEDLWNLVGASTPSIMSKAVQEGPVSGETSKREEQSPLDSASLPESHLGQTVQAPVVQRQAASLETVEPGSAPPPAGEDAVEEQAGEEMDIEELARRVYSELKHRLGLEWERLRRR